MKLIDICFLLLLFIVIGYCIAWIYYIWQREKKGQELKKQLWTLFQEKEQKIELNYEKLKFKPYLGICFQECSCYDKTGKEIGSIEKDTFHTVVWEESGKCKLLDGRWIDKKFITQNYQKKEFSQLAQLKEESFLLNGPSIGYQKLTDLPAGGTVIVMAIYGAWAKVTVFDNIIGYTLKDNLIPIDKPA